MRLPVDRMRVTLVLETGEALTGDVFLAPGEAVRTVLDEAEPFVPLGLERPVNGSIETHVRLVARATIACVAVPGEVPRDPDVHEETQRARVRLKAGLEVEGELRWVARVGHRRTVDHLNLPSRLLEVHGASVTTYIIKAHVAWVEEC